MLHWRGKLAVAAVVLLLLFHPVVSTKLSEFHVQETPLDKVPVPPIIDLAEVLIANDNVSSSPHPHQQQQQQQQQSPREMVPDRDEDEEDEKCAKKKDPSKSSSSTGSVFNFASHTAGAVVLAVSPAAKGFSNLLDDDMDRYGISPCDEKKWVVIGLSEDILVTSVVIANYERYSSMLKNFQLLASTIYPTEEWINLGTYVASPRLGEQTFNVTQTSAHTRYVKLKFLTHYDNEALCTLSQIKVHGTTVIASFKEEVELSDTDMRSMLFTLSDEVEGVVGATNISAGSEGSSTAVDAVQALQSTGTSIETQGETSSSAECTSPDGHCPAPTAPASGAVNGTLQTPVAAASNATTPAISSQASFGDAADKPSAPSTEGGGEVSAPSTFVASTVGAGAAAAAAAGCSGALTEPASEATTSASMAHHTTSDTAPPAESGSAASTAGTGVGAGLARHSLETVVKSVKDIVTPLLTIAPLVPPLASSSLLQQQQAAGSGDATVSADEPAATTTTTPPQPSHQPQPPATERSAAQEEAQSSGALHATEADAALHSSSFSSGATNVAVAAESNAASITMATPPSVGADAAEGSAAASGVPSSLSSSAAAAAAAAAEAEEAASPSTNTTTAAAVAEAAAADAAASDARDDVGSGPMVVGPAAHLGRGIETVVKSMAEIVTPLLAVNPNPNPSPSAGAKPDDAAASVAVPASSTEGQEQHLAETGVASASSASPSAPDALTSASASASASASVEQGASASDLGPSSVDPSGPGAGGEKDGEHVVSELSLPLQAAERSVDAMTKHVVLLGSATSTTTVPVSSAAVTTACAELMRFSDFNAKMLAKLQAAAKPTEDRPVPLTGVHENVFRVLMAKIKSLEMSQAILEMYTGQLGDCYRSVEMERRSGERDELRLAEDLAARVRGRFENEVRMYLVVCVLGAAAGLLALFRSSPSLFGSAPASAPVSASASVEAKEQGAVERPSARSAVRSRSGQGRRRL